jgi:alpha-galactosidase
MKICIIGAGSVGFSRTLIADLAAVPEFADLQISLHDINADNLRMLTQLVERDLAAAGVAITLEPTTNRVEAVRGASYVLSTFRVGGLEAFEHDVAIPLRYGVDQCVGDTICAGGLMYAQRGIPVLMDLCRDIAEHGAPGCRLFNYANPMAMMTWAGNRSGVEVIGLCHGVQGSEDLLSQVLDIPKAELDFLAAGINHQTWFLSVGHQGRELRHGLVDAFLAKPDIAAQERVRIDVMKRFGYWSTESNGHLSEYLPWYRKKSEQVGQWISDASWIHGQTGGYLSHCKSRHNWSDDEFPQMLAEPPASIGAEHRSHEHGSWLIEALETGRIYRGNINVPNGGIIPNLPTDAIVEVPAYVDRRGLNTPVVGDLPLGCAAVCNASITVQRMGVEAALSGDDELLRQAMLMDPLVGAVCTTQQVWDMVDDLLIALEPWMPQYATAAEAARRRRPTAVAKAG